MSTKYKFIYFNSRGRGEPSRWVFAAAGVEYEDKRVNSEEWKELKPNTPSGQLPVLEVDGVMMFQSQAITRFLAKQFGLAGKSPMDQFKVDAVVDTIRDAMKPLIDLFMSRSDKEKFEELRKKFKEEQLPTQLKTLEKMATDQGHFIEQELTWADIEFTQFMEMVGLFQITDILDVFPKLKKIVEKTRAHPKIAEWIKKRPETDH